MHKLILFVFALAILSCKNEPKNYLSLSGKIENPHESKAITVFQGKNYSKEISMNEDGTFNDTLNIKSGIYVFKHGEQYGQIYLENDNNIRLTTDYTDFDNQLKFEGKNADKSTFFIEKTLMIQNTLDANVMDLPEAEFNQAIEKVKSAYTDLKEKFSTLDSTFFASEDKDLNGMTKMYSEYYQSRLAMRKELPKGKASPRFVDYENHKGGKTSLTDLKGKYIYIDVWATWCGPCIAEIPALKEVEKKYHNKNIEFVSISIDTEKAYDKWKQMVVDKELGGVQLLADANWKSQFITDYKINGIPRFILIDPDGNIVNADAPRPSSEKLIELFEELNI